MFSMVLATSSALSVTISRYSKTDFTLMILIGSLLSKTSTIPWLSTSSAMFSKELILMQDSLTSLGLQTLLSF